MTALQPLLALLGQTERERDEVSAQLRSASQALQSAKDQAEQLIAYRGDYEQRWNAQFRESGKMEIVNHYRSFMDRLTTAVEQQQRVVRNADQLVEQGRLALRESETRVASVRKLIERRVNELQQTADRREQRQTDEFAARAAWNQRAADPSGLSIG